MMRYPELALTGGDGSYRTFPVLEVDPTWEVANAGGHIDIEGSACCATQDNCTMLSRLKDREIQFSGHCISKGGRHGKAQAHGEESEKEGSSQQKAPPSKEEAWLCRQAGGTYHGIGR
jgi:hypothetical protein